MIPLGPISANDYYEIEYIRQSGYSLLLFARHAVTSEHVVIKILRKYKDTVFSLETISERQQCQLEALHWNRVFTPKVYIGLAAICSLDLYQKSIGIDKVIINPTKEMLDPNAEYVLLMHQLVENRRLDYLLKEGDKVSLQSSLQLLTKRVAHVHTSLAELSTIDENRLQWGSFEQLRRKLEHNLVFIEPMLSISKKGRYDFYDWLEETLNSLKETLTRVFAQSQYSKYFEQRLRGHYIKRCHGDLKALNIWIAPYDLSLDDASGMYISILDVIDFNPIYSNIDILSDFAMLVVDIEARTKSSSLANSMVEDYLKFTKQQGEVSKAVLAYYLVEKALVGAAVNIIYDNLPELGRAFLEVAEMRMKDLKSRLDT